MKFAQVMFLQVSVCPQGEGSMHGCPGGHAWLPGGRHAWLVGGHVWLSGGMRGEGGSMHGIQRDTEI